MSLAILMIQDWARYAAWAYVAVFAIAFGLALRLPRAPILKVRSATGVLIVFSILPLLVWWHARQAERQQQAVANAFQARLFEAQALFAERCRTSGEKTHRRVDGVAGVVWLTWRTNAFNQDDQFRMDDPYGHDCTGDGCILQLLRVTRNAHLLPEAVSRHPGRYAYVEAIDPSDQGRYRYAAIVKSLRKRTPEQIEAYKRNTKGIDPGPDVWGIALERTLVDRFAARYGIRWDDVSTRDDREHWIAGGTLQIVDLQTNELLAERIGYMMDPGHGNRRNARQPWSFARDNACPPLRDSSGKRSAEGHTVRFVQSVLRPMPQE